MWGNIFIKDFQVHEDPRIITERLSGYVFDSVSSEKSLNESESIRLLSFEFTHTNFNVYSIFKAFSTLKRTDGISTSMLKKVEVISG